jgi:hypothetical protein
MRYVSPAVNCQPSYCRRGLVELMVFLQLFDGVVCASARVSFNAVWTSKCSILTFNIIYCIHLWDSEYNESNQKKKL